MKSNFSKLAIAFSRAVKPSTPTSIKYGFVRSSALSSPYSSSQSQPQEVPSKCDVCIIGGGAMGSSTAFWLKHHPAGKNLKVVVIERDPRYTKASTVLSLGGIRQQFSNGENVQLSLYGMEFINRIQDFLGVEGESPVDIHYTKSGYLFLASTPEGAQTLHENHKVQREFDSKVELLSNDQLKRKFPWINADDIVLSSYGITNEGWFDPWSLLNGFKKKAISLGVQYIPAEVVGFDKVSNNGSERSVGPTQLQIKEESGQVKSIEFSHCVIAAGYNSGHVGSLAGIGTGKGMLSTPVPVEPRKRYVYFLNAPTLKEYSKDFPLLIDGTGVYVRPEGSPGNFYTGRSPECDEDEPTCENLDVDYSFFESAIWPVLAHRVPDFENQKIKYAWGGYYDYNTFDQNGIIGTHPCYQNFHIITGFSGHGIQQSPAGGRAVMELILEGGFKNINLSRFGFDRVIEGRKLLEKNIV